MLKANLTKYTKLLKILSIISVLIGFTTLVETILPPKTISTKVLSKNSSYRAKFDKTTYNIYFENNNDQFTEEIFSAFAPGDEVVLTASYFHEETSKIKDINTGKVYINDTGEVYFQYLFALIFILPGLSWLKRRNLSNKQCKYIIFIILFSLTDLYRILKHI